MEEGAGRRLWLKLYPGGEEDGLQSPAFRIGVEEKEGHPTSSWRKGGKGRE
jgi:hypothetical protein